MKHFLFGYGSLINRQSRIATGKTGTAIPALVKGFQRAWIVRSPEMGITGVGVVPKCESLCNGVLVEIEEQEILLFDKRELEGTGYNYERKEIPHSQIIEGGVPDDAKVWIYVVKRPSTPNWDYPIAQSYLDVILVGCFDFGYQFAAQFVQLTDGWSYPWINDRKCPRYKRALQNVPIQKIDAFLMSHLDSFKDRKDIDC